MSEGSLRDDLDAAPVRKKRAPSMAPGDRRLQLIDATVPLIRRHGSAVTTAQVAEAAGVAEGTIFRLFVDKHALLDAVLEHALDADALLDALARLSPDLTLQERITRAASAIRDHFEHALPVMHGAMRHGQSARAGAAVGIMFAEVLEATESLFRQELARGRVRGDARTLSRMLVGVCQSVVWQDFFEHRDEPTPTAEFTAVLIEGCLAAGERTPQRGE
jgi:AcrR family transcriptional regulator